MKKTKDSPMKIARKTMGLTQEKAAEELHISQEALSNYENGKREPGGDTLKKMSETYGVSIDFLVTGKEADFGKVVRGVLEKMLEDKKDEIIREIVDKLEDIIKKE